MRRIHAALIGSASEQAERAARQAAEKHALHVEAEQARMERLALERMYSPSEELRTARSLYRLPAEHDAVFQKRMRLCRELAVAEYDLRRAGDITSRRADALKRIHTFQDLLLDTLSNGYTPSAAFYQP